MTHIKPLLVLIAAIAFGLSPLVTSPFGGYAPSLFPVQIAQPAIQPAGYAFSIWGLIYTWLLLHAGFGLWKRADDPAWDRLRLPLIVSLGVGAFWLWIAARDPILATVAIAIMLGGALVALWRAPSSPDRWLRLAPLAIYAGWLNAATGVSFGVVLAGYGIMSNTIAALMMLSLVLAFALIMQLRLGRAPEYGLTVIWALVGVIVANGAANRPVSTLAGVGILLLTGAIWRISRR